MITFHSTWYMVCSHSQKAAAVSEAFQEFLLAQAAHHLQAAYIEESILLYSDNCCCTLVFAPEVSSKQMVITQMDNSFPRRSTLYYEIERFILHWLQNHHYNWKNPWQLNVSSKALLINHNPVLLGSVRISQLVQKG